MTNEGSPGAPHLSYSNPTSGIMPRRSSYASVAAGTAGVTSDSRHLPRIVNTGSYTHSTSLDQPSRIPQPISDSDARVEGGMDIPSSWGRGGSFSNPRFPSQSYGSAGSGGILGFFEPSYLKESKYMEKLKAAHKAKLAAQADEVPTRSSKPGSLSTSSSSVSLHKMAPSHRGMTYEIIERQPEVEDDGLTPLPSKWAETDKNAGLEISADGQDVKFVGPSKTFDHEASSTRSDNPMPAQCGIYYYEVSIISKGKEGMIGVGFSGASASLEKLPGWEPDSWAYHGDDGKSFCAATPGKPYGPTFTSGDVIGCGVNFMKGCAFFTKNGVFQGNAFRDLRDVKVYPSVGMKRPHAHLSVNFGQRPFMFDIDRMVSRERQSIIDEVNAADVSNLHPTLNKDELCKALVAQYLSHDGYVETARAFASEVRAEATALRGSPELKLEGYLSVEEDHDAVNRQQIRTAILDGNIDKAIELTNACYPHVLQENPQIYFKLRCRKFIEMMRQSTELLDNSTSKQTKSSTTNGHSTAVSDDGFEPDMDLDDPIATKDSGQQNNDDWDRMDTEETIGGDNWGLKYQTLLGVIIRYGQELKHEFKDDRSKHVTDTFTDIFSMFSYPDPRKSPQGKLLDSEQRVPVAEGLNSAILVSLGKSSSTALERLYKQTVVLVDMISEDGGPGSFINVRNLLQSSRKSWQQ